MGTPSTRVPVVLPMPAFAVKRGIAQAEAIPDAAVVLYEHVADDCHTATLIVLGYYYECPRIVLCSGETAHVLIWNWDTNEWESLLDKATSDLAEDV